MYFSGSEDDEIIMVKDGEDENRNGKKGNVVLNRTPDDNVSTFGKLRKRS